MALWESLSNTERGAELELTFEQAAELDRRWVEHVQRPESSTPWNDVRRRLNGAEVTRRAATAGMTQGRTESEMGVVQYGKN